MIRSKCHLKKDDKVKITVGKDKGKIGKVLRIDHKKNRVLVENINIVKRHVRPSAKTGQGGIIESEATIAWSNVMLVCSKCMETGRIKMKRLEDGKKVRVCRKCDEMIDA